MSSLHSKWETPLSALFQEMAFEIEVCCRQHEDLADLRDEVFSLGCDYFRAPALSDVFSTLWLR